MTDAVLALAVGLVQAVVVVRWFAAVDVPGEREGRLIACAAAVVADVLVARADEVHPMGPAAAVGGLAVLAALLQQLARRDGRDRLTASLAGTVTLAALVTIGAGYLAAVTAEDGGLLVSAAVACAAVVAAGVWLPGRELVSWVLGAVLALAAGVAVLVVGGATAGTAAGVPVAATAAAVLGRALAARVPRPDPWLGAALPFLLVGPAALVAARLLSP